MRREDLVYDVGMHRGEDTEYYLKKGFRVVAFEANPALAGYCRSRFASELKSGRLSMIEGAIVPEGYLEDSITFFVNERKSAFGTIDEDWVKRNGRLGARSSVVTVPAIRFTQWVEHYGVPYYMKIDIEGVDLECVSALRGFADRPSYLSLESSKRSLDDIAAELALLADLGYDRFTAVQQMSVAGATEVIGRDDGSTDVFRFKFGSSGPFGEALKAEWRTKDGVIEQYRRIFEMYRRWGDDTIWQKNVALRAATRLFHLVTGSALPGWYDTHARHSTAS